MNDGGPAFGQVVELRCVRVEMDGLTEWEPEAMLHGDLTVRDYFAAKAMQGAFTSPIASSEREKDYIAMHAYSMADAMIRAREKRSEK